MNLTYTDLVHRLVDLERLAEPPAVGEQGGCCSSYDRRSRYDPEPEPTSLGRNDDGSGFIRMEGDWIVVFEREGPGVIWRLVRAAGQWTRADFHRRRPEAGGRYAVPRLFSSGSMRRSPA